MDYIIAVRNGVPVELVNLPAALAKLTYLTVRGATPRTAQVQIPTAAALAAVTAALGDKCYIEPVRPRTRVG